MRLTSALRSGLKERGWGKKTLSFSVDLAPSGWVQAPLELVVSKEVDPAKYGGVSLSASATIWSSRVSDVIKLLPAGCLDELTEGEIADGVALPRLAHVDFDALTSSRWRAVTEAELEMEVAQFFRVDGPLRQWATGRSTHRQQHPPVRTLRDHHRRLRRRHRPTRSPGSVRQPTSACPRRRGSGSRTGR